MIKIIQLTQGFTSEVSSEDYELVNAYKWHVSMKRNRALAQTTLPNGESVLMHRFILNAPIGVLVDHINGNTLDNSRSNLRFASAKENGRNHKAKGSSGFNGVKKTSSGWIAMIAPSGMEITLGTFADAEQAASAYNEAAKKVYGIFARLNDVPEVDGILQKAIDKKRNKVKRLLAEISLLEGI